MKRRALTELSDTELLRELARRKKSEPKPPKKKIDWSKVWHKCPRCKVTEGPVDRYFGVRTIRGRELKQSWCANCRSTTNYHARPRVNRVT